MTAPFKVGDAVEVISMQPGTVIHVGKSTCTVKTEDGKEITAPFHFIVPAPGELVFPELHWQGLEDGIRGFLPSRPDTTLFFITPTRQTYGVVRLMGMFIPDDKERDDRYTIDSAKQMAARYFAEGIAEFSDIDAAMKAAAKAREERRQAA